MNITNSTIYHNSAVSTGPGIHNSLSTLKVENSILWSNSSLFFGPQIVSFGFPLPTVRYSDIKGGYLGLGNINQAQLFQAPANGDLRLTVNSPCIDVADGDVAPATDIFGYPRYDEPTKPNNGAGTPDYVDMGAYEYVDPCSIIVCDDPGPCETEEGAVCVDGACQYPVAPVGTVCDDNNTCTLNDVCQAGKSCEGSEVITACILVQGRAAAP